MKCVWLNAREPSDDGPAPDELHHLRPPIDNRLWGTSSWKNLLTGRDKHVPGGWRVQA
jgi:hypothetical protein